MNLLEITEAMQDLDEDSALYKLLKILYKSHSDTFNKWYKEWANACNEVNNHEEKLTKTEQEEENIAYNWPQELKSWYIQISIEGETHQILNSSGFRLETLKEIDEALKETIESQLDNIDKDGVSFLKVNMAALIEQDGSPIFTKDAYCMEKEIKLAIDKLQLVLSSDDAYCYLNKDYIISPCFQDIFL